MSHDDDAAGRVPVNALMVERAVRALRAFGDLSREEAARVLPLWRYRQSLTDAEVAAVLARFQPAASGEGPVQESGTGPGGW